MSQKNKTGVLPLIPVISILFIFYIGGIIFALLQSLGIVNISDLTLRPDFHYYTDLLSSEEFINSLQYTFRISLLSSAAAGITGFFYVYIIYQLKHLKVPGNLFIQRLIQTPMLIPYLAASYFIILMFSRTGIFSRILFNAGMMEGFENFPVLTNDKSGSGIILTFAWKASPFVLMMVYPVLLRIEDKWKQAADVFGAGSFQFFKNVILKMIWPAWLSSVFLIFAFAFSTFEVPYILGVTYPKTLSVLAYEIFINRDPQFRPEAMALGIIILVITSVSGVFIFKLNARWTNDAAKRW